MHPLYVICQLITNSCTCYLCAKNVNLFLGTCIVLLYNYFINMCLFYTSIVNNELNT